MDTLKIPGVKNIIIIPSQEIIRIEAVRNYSRIHFSDGKKLVTAKVLNWFENLLPADMFVRVHRSHLINKLFIHQINGGDLKVLMLINGEFIAVSRRKKAGLTLD